MNYKVRITDSAKSDLNDIILYMKNVLENASAAKKFIDGIRKKYIVLSENPYIYSLCFDAALKERGYRKIVIKNYLIFYIVNEENKTVNIMRIIYGKRDYINLI